MTDIVERLRGNAIGNPARIPWPHRLLHDAAEEIERLRAALEFYGPGHQYDAWCCWNAIMLARAALAQGGDK